MTATPARMTAWVLALLLAGAAADAAAQPNVSAVRVDEPPVIDGLLADIGIHERLSALPRGAREGFDACGGR